MGRHTKNVEDDLPEDDGSDRRRRVGKVPLLPAVTGVVAIGAVVSAISTQQISLNFAGGTPPSSQQAKPEGTGTTQPDGKRTRHSTARDDSTLTPRQGNGVSRSGGRTVTVTFRTVATWQTGFLGEATITNRTTAPIQGWTLILRYSQRKILSAWDVKLIQKGTTLIADNPPENPTITPGKSARVSFVADGAAARPTSCSFNGKPC
jgi:hypothetical protein